MASNHQGPLWNEDLVLAIGLTLAGMAVLQGKLFAAAAKLNLQHLEALLGWRGLEWWPVLLIVGGVILWLRRTRANSSRKRMQSSAQKGS